MGHENYQDIVSSQSSTDPKMLLRPLTFLLLTISSAIPLTPHELEARENDQNGTVVMFRIQLERRVRRDDRALGIQQLHELERSMGIQRLLSRARTRHSVLVA